MKSATFFSVGCLGENLGYQDLPWRQLLLLLPDIVTHLWIPQIKFHQPSPPLVIEWLCNEPECLAAVVKQCGQLQAFLLAHTWPYGMLSPCPNGVTLFMMKASRVRPIYSHTDRGLAKAWPSPSCEGTRHGGLIVITQLWRPLSRSNRAALHG